MRYIPHTEAERRSMMEVIGIQDIDELFADVPADVRYPQLDLPQPMTEMEVMRELDMMAAENANLREFASFLGAGAYNHFVPAIVDTVISRGEFYTAYTPYQPEISQGTLQAAFEYQSMVAALTGMEVVNASHYDGATAVAEAAIMAVNVLRHKRRTIVVSPACTPNTGRCYAPTPRAWR